MFANRGGVQLLEVWTMCQKEVNSTVGLFLFIKIRGRGTMASDGQCTDALSPVREKRVSTTVITPNNVQEKRKKTKYEFKKSQDVIPKNLMSNPVEAYMIKLRGNIDLFYFDQGQTEAFVNPVIDLLTGKGDDTHNWKVHKEQLSTHSKIIAVVPRRKSRNEDEPEWKFVATKTDPNAKFKKHYFVSYDEKGDDVSQEERKSRLESVLKVWNVLNFRYQVTCLEVREC